MKKNIKSQIVMTIVAFTLLAGMMFIWSFGTITIHDIQRPLVKALDTTK